MFSVNKILRNGFQELPEPNKEDIARKVVFKIKNIASSTGLSGQRIEELAERYIAKVESLCNNYSTYSV